MQKYLFVFTILIYTAYRTVNAAHFRGGTITWRPLNSTPSGSTVDIQIRQRYSWRRTNVPCTAATIAAKGAIGDSTPLACCSGSCTGLGTLTTSTSCTDFSAISDVSSGEKLETKTFALNTQRSIAYSSGNWFGDLVVGANSGWSLVTLINTMVRPDGYINSSPVATTLPVIYKAINIQHIYVVQMSDFDGTDTLKCRWSTASGNINGCNECSGVCGGLPGAQLFQNNCTLKFTLTQATKYAAVALQIEDYYSLSSPTPMSSVSLQFLFYGYSTPGGCSTPPSIIGARPNRACIGVEVGQNINEVVIAEVGCPGKSIIDFTTSTPVGMTKSVIQNPSTGIYQIVLTWVPTNIQRGPQGFCAGAVDNTNVQSDQWCITFLVGYQSPDIIRPTAVQGSASPLGMIMQTHTTFSIQTTMRVDRPQRNGTKIHFKDSTTNTVVLSYDCGWAPEVTYTGYTIVIRVPQPTPWIPGHDYYVMFDSGVASGTEFCGPESAPITDPSFWYFNIWNPILSSPGTNATTPPTTGTVTTRAPSTTTPNTQMTTTGIVITTPTTVTTTTATTSSSSTTSTSSTATTATTTTTLPEVSVMYPKEMEKACEQPLIIANVVGMGSMAVIHGLGMFAMFTKFANMFNPAKVKAQLRYKQRLRSFRQK